jgi:hypothetical protein
MARRQAEAWGKLAVSEGLGCDEAVRQWKGDRLYRVLVEAAYRIEERKQEERRQRETYRRGDTAWLAGLRDLVAGREGLAAKRARAWARRQKTATENEYAQLVLDYVTTYRDAMSEGLMV